MRLAVVIVSYNVCDLLRRCLQSVFASARQSESWLAVDVTVVDNASHDGSAQMVAGEFPHVNLIAMADNIGFTRANNFALRGLGFGADGRERAPSVPDLVLLLNPDTEVVDDALGKLAAFMRDNRSAGACGPRLHYEDGSLQHGGFAFPGLAQVALDLLPLAGLPGLSRLLQRLLQSRLNGRYSRRQWLGVAPFPVDFVLGAALMARGDSIRAVGLLDEGYFMYCEEMDWCLRMGEAGLPTYAVPAAQIVHYEGRSSSQIRWKSFERLWASRFRFFRRHAHLYPHGFHLFLRPLVRLGLAWNRWIARREFARGRLSGDRLGEQLDAYAKVLDLGG
ncbi:MAG: glycosyltransferase family 2 protein [Caldilineaceae bacterium]|nr:glycosyltransferase family 2 protein [Caldilineaceae bacterium]